LLRSWCNLHVHATDNLCPAIRRAAGPATLLRNINPAMDRDMANSKPRLMPICELGDIRPATEKSL